MMYISSMDNFALIGIAIEVSVVCTGLYFAWRAYLAERNRALEQLCVELEEKLEDARFQAVACKQVVEEMVADGVVDGRDFNLRYERALEESRRKLNYAVMQLSDRALIARTRKMNAK